MVPLQMGIPGGPELLVILLIMVILFGIPLVLLGIGGFVYLRSNADGDDGDEDTQERIARLEGEIDQLKADLDTETATDDEQATGEGNDDPQAGA
jgi:sec-independent protein translocase protein TatA